MSISGVARRLRRVTSRQLVWAVALAASGVGVASDPHRSNIDLIIRAAFLFTGPALFGLTLEAIRGAPVDRRAILAYLPLAFALLTFYYARVTSAHVARAGSLDTFFGAATSLLGLLLVSMVVEARRVGAHDQWLRALRGWWVAFIVIGILFGLLGLTPDQSRTSQMANYAWVWAGLVGAVTALAVVMWRDPAPQPGALAQEREIASPYGQTPAQGLAVGVLNTSTRTPVRSTPAAHQAARR
jgi:hypothetical protein